MTRRRLEDAFFKALMVASLAAVLASLAAIIAVVLAKGGASLNVAMLTQTPRGGYYLGGAGGILNAIVGSLYLASAATALAFVFSLAVATALQKDYLPAPLAAVVRLCLDLLWGIPSIVYGVFCFVVMMAVGVGTSLLAGIAALTLLEVPIMTRCMDEAIRSVPAELKEASYSLGSRRFETSRRVAWKQAILGLISAVLLAFGRGIGDAASILFTAGFTDHVPTRLTDSAAALPTMIFFLATSPYEAVRERAYAAAFVLLVIVLILSTVSRLVGARFSRYLIR
jgi:phosphate transport system permease protein